MCAGCVENAVEDLLWLCDTPKPSNAYCSDAGNLCLAVLVLALHNGSPGTIVGCLAGSVSQ